MHFIRASIRKSRFSALLAALLAFYSVEALAKPDVARGRELFDRQTCSMCHPGGGNVLNPKKPLKGTQFQRDFPADADVARVIRKGVSGTAMDAFRNDRLSDDELLDIIAFIRSLTPPAAASENKNGAAKPAASGKVVRKTISPRSSGGGK